MKTTTIKTTTHEENWRVCNELYKQGFCKKADCMWTKIYENSATNERAIIVFEYNI